MEELDFIKMQGAGNDFVVLDGRARTLALGPAALRSIAERRFGIGCDQVVVMTPPRHAEALLRLRFYNPDGGEAGACGNGTRCAARLVMEETGRQELILETEGGLLSASRDGAGRITVDMGAPRFDWQAVPLAEPRDTLRLDLARGPLRDPVALSMGNPHAVFFVEAPVGEVDLARLGPELEHDPLFPKRANISVARILGPAAIELRVWERGAGETLACGSGACAAAVAAHRRGLSGREVAVALPGGRLDITWRDDGHVLMRGPTAKVCSGRIAPELLAAGS
jgi:diaminopimelate epimerase